MIDAAGKHRALIATMILGGLRVSELALMATAQKQNWALVALDCAVDTSTPAGDAMANMLATFSQFERRLISQRTKEALAVKRASGVRLGRPPTMPDSVVQQIQRQRARGDSLRKIAVDLNADGIPTAHGGAQWYAATCGTCSSARRSTGGAAPPPRTCDLERGLLAGSCF